MTFRVVRCPSCGHALRPGARLCGKCGDVTPTLNLWVRPIAVAGAILLLGSAILLVQMALG